MLLAALDRDSVATELQLSFPLSARLLSALSKGLATTATLKRLTLDGSRIGTEGVQALKQGLLDSSSLEELSLVGCALTPEAAIVLASIVKHRAARCDSQHCCSVAESSLYSGCSLPVLLNTGSASALLTCYAGHTLTLLAGCPSKAGKHS